MWTLTLFAFLAGVLTGILLLLAVQQGLEAIARCEEDWID